MKRHQHGHDSLVQDKSIKAMLGDDYPERVKLALRLAAKGGRQVRRRCAVCGATGVQCDLYLPPGALNVGQEVSQGMALYWTCQHCHEQGLTPELETALRQRVRR